SRLTVIAMDNPRVAVVTGGGRGIGRGIVAALAARGLSVVVNFRADAHSARAACDEARSLGAPDTLSVQADVSDLSQHETLIGCVLDRFGRIDTWINNAGVAPEVRVDLLETTTQSWDRVLSTNLRGPFFLTQAVARAMIELKSTGRVTEPRIVFVTSVS